MSTTGGPTEPCVNCGTAIPADAKACPGCGVRRIPVDPSASYPPVAPPPGGSSQPGYGQPTYVRPQYPPQEGSAPPGYGQPTYVRPQYPPPGGYGQTSNGKAIASLVLGIVGIFICQIASVVAIVLGGQAAREIRFSGGRQKGEGMAMAGRVLGWIGVALFVVFVLLILSGFLGRTTTGT